MKHWIDGEEGRQAVLDVSNIPEAVQVLTQACNKHILMLTSRLLELNISDSTKDRQWLVAKAELDGAKGLTQYMMRLLNEAGRPRKSKE